MNKLINLILIFFALYFSLPILFKIMFQKGEISTPIGIEFKLAFLVLVFIYQMVYKMIIRSVADEKINFGELLQNSLLNGLLYLTGFLVYLDLIKIFNSVFQHKDDSFKLVPALIVSSMPSVIYLVGKSFLKPH